MDVVEGAGLELHEHVAALVAWKRAARYHRGLDRVQQACASAAAFFHAAAARQANLGALTTGLTTLLDGYGAPAVEAALAGALTAQAPHLAAVRQLLEQHRQAHRQPQPIAVALPADARVRDLVVQPHALTTYDDLHAERKDSDDDDTAH
jgi:ABC-type transporter Mla subunit MlaD